MLLVVEVVLFSSLLLKSLAAEQNLPYLMEREILELRPGNLVGFWPLDERNAGDRARDLSGYGNDLWPTMREPLSAALQPGVYLAEGDPGTLSIGDGYAAEFSRRFSGLGNRPTYLSAKDMESGPGRVDGEFTLFARIRLSRPPLPGAGRSEYGIVSKISRQSGLNGFALVLSRGPSGQTFFEFRWGAGAAVFNPTIVAAPIFVGSMRWYDVACVVSEPDSSIRIYIDGVLSVEKTVADLTVDTMSPDSGEFRIGATEQSRSVFDGQIGHVAVWDVALARDQVSRLSFARDATAWGRDAGPVFVPKNRPSGRWSSSDYAQTFELPVRSHVGGVRLNLLSTLMGHELGQTRFWVSLMRQTGGGNSIEVVSGGQSASLDGSVLPTASGGDVFFAFPHTPELEPGTRYWLLLHGETDIQDSSLMGGVVWLTRGVEHYPYEFGARFRSRGEQWNRMDSGNSRNFSFSLAKVPAPVLAGQIGNSAAAPFARVEHERALAVPIELPGGKYFLVRGVCFRLAHVGEALPGVRAVLYEDEGGIPGRIIVASRPLDSDLLPRLGSRPVGLDPQEVGFYFGEDTVVEPGVQVWVGLELVGGGTGEGNHYWVYADQGERLLGDSGPKSLRHGEWVDRSPFEPGLDFSLLGEPLHGRIEPNALVRVFEGPGEGIEVRQISRIHERYVVGVGASEGKEVLFAYDIVSGSQTMANSFHVLPPVPGVEPTKYLTETVSFNSASQGIGFHAVANPAPELQEDSSSPLKRPLRMFEGLAATLPEGVALDVSSTGVVVGSLEKPGVAEAVYWPSSHTGAELVPFLSVGSGIVSSVATAVSPNVGRFVAGWLQDHPVEQFPDRIPFLWDRENLEEPAELFHRPRNGYILESIEAVASNGVAFGVGRVDGGFSRRVLRYLPKDGEIESLGSLGEVDSGLKSEPMHGSTVVVNGGAEPLIWTPVDGFVSFHDFLRRFPLPEPFLQGWSFEEVSAIGEGAKYFAGWGHRDGTRQAFVVDLSVFDRNRDGCLDVYDVELPAEPLIVPVSGRPSIEFVADQNTAFSEDAGSIEIRVIKTGDGEASVNFKVEESRAAPSKLGEDYLISNPAPYSLQFEAGSPNEQVIIVRLIDDVIFEPGQDELIHLVLEQPHGGSLGLRRTFTIELADNDEPISDTESAKITKPVEPGGEPVPIYDRRWSLALSETESSQLFNLDFGWRFPWQTHWTTSETAPNLRHLVGLGVQSDVGYDILARPVAGHRSPDSVRIVPPENSDRQQIRDWKYERLNDLRVGGVRLIVRDAPPGIQWRILGRDWVDNGGTDLGIPAGVQLLELKVPETMPWFGKPVREISVVEGLTASVEYQYQENPNLVGRDKGEGDIAARFDVHDPRENYRRIVESVQHRDPTRPLLPLPLVGQFRNAEGDYFSGFAVSEKVVLTVAHPLVKKGSSSELNPYVEWYPARDATENQSAPYVAPSSNYVIFPEFMEVLAREEAGIEDADLLRCDKSRWDIAAVFFDVLIADGWSSGFLAAETPDRWFREARPKILAGYPIGIGSDHRLWWTKAKEYEFDPFPGTSDTVFVTNEIYGAPGLSGSPLMLKGPFGGENTYFPFAIHVKHEVTFRESFYRAIDHEVVTDIIQKAITRAVLASDNVSDPIHVQEQVLSERCVGDAVPCPGELWIHVEPPELRDRVKARVYKIGEAASEFEALSAPFEFHDGDLVGIEFEKINGWQEPVVEPFEFLRSENTAYVFRYEPSVYIEPETRIDIAFCGDMALADLGRLCTELTGSSRNLCLSVQGKVGKVVALYRTEDLGADISDWELAIGPITIRESCSLVWEIPIQDLGRASYYHLVDRGSSQ